MPPRLQPPTIIDFEEPDYEIYDNWKEFTLVQAAFLWKEQNPSTAMLMDTGVQGVHSMLLQAVQGGDLKAFVRLQGQKRDARKFFNMVDEAIVTPDDLRQFVEDRGLPRPKFLYQEEAGGWL